MFIKLQKILPNAAYALFQSDITLESKQFLRLRNHRSAAHRVVLCPRRQDIIIKNGKL